MSQKPSSRFVEQAQASGCVREALIPSAPVLDGGSSSLEKTRAQHSDPAPYHADKLWQSPGDVEGPSQPEKGQSESWVLPEPASCSAEPSSRAVL